MQRKDCSCSLEKRIVTTACAEFLHRETGLPIVAVDDVGLPVEMLQQRECGTREESEANVIVLVAVDVGAAEELRRFEKISSRARGVAQQEAHGMDLTAPLDAHV